MRIKTAVFACVLGAMPTLLGATSGVTLTVTLEGGKAGQGDFVVGLFDTEENWLKTVVRETRVPVGPDGTAVVRFESLTAGVYAISSYQDKNVNGKIDTVLGIPREPYAFSNQARSLFGPAKFREAAFELGSQDETVAIRYP